MLCGNSVSDLPKFKQYIIKCTQAMKTNVTSFCWTKTHFGENTCVQQAKRIYTNRLENLISKSCKCNHFQELNKLLNGSLDLTSCEIWSLSLPIQYIYDFTLSPAKDFHFICRCDMLIGERGLKHHFVGNLAVFIVTTIWNCVQVLNDQKKWITMHH